MKKRKINNLRKGCIDVFKTFLISNATFSGIFDFPIINACKEVPNSLISFSKSLTNHNYNCWIHFYEDDFLFERIWNNPKKYLQHLKKFNGIILPDFSLYRDMPLVMQLWNIYRSRAIGVWLQKNGIKVIPNIRFGDYRTYQICCNGIHRKSVISVSCHGLMKNQEDKKIFLDGLNVIIKQLEPCVLVIYGGCSLRFFKKYEENGLRIIQFIPEYYFQLQLDMELI